MDKKQKKEKTVAPTSTTKDASKDKDTAKKTIDSKDNKETPKEAPKDVILFATMDGSRGDTNIERLEEKVKMRGARVIESFTIATKDKDSEKLITDTEAVIEMKDLKMYTR